MSSPGLLAVFLLAGAVLPGLVFLARKLYEKALDRFTPRPAIELPKVVLPEESDEEE